MAALILMQMKPSTAMLRKSGSPRHRHHAFPCQTERTRTSDVGAAHRLLLQHSRRARFSRSTGPTLRCRWRPPAPSPDRPRWPARSCGSRDLPEARQQHLVLRPGRLGRGIGQDSDRRRPAPTRLSSGSFRIPRLRKASLAIKWRMPCHFFIFQLFEWCTAVIPASNPADRNAWHPAVR